MPTLLGDVLLFSVLGRMGRWNRDRDLQRAQLIVATRMGELGREAPPRTERRNPAPVARGGVLLLPSRALSSARGGYSAQCFRF
jgi:hypothetical protein